MYWKIAIALIGMFFVRGCQSEQPDADPSIPTSDGMCVPLLKTSDYLPQAEKGDEEAIHKAIMYYGGCGGNADPASNSKYMYWAKKIADTGDIEYIEAITGAAYIQLDPKNNSKNFNLPTDPLLVWAWYIKACEYKKAHPKDLEAQDMQCDPLPKPAWLTEAQWQKIITSPPTVKDKRWMQYLPKGCEQGQCLPR